MKTRVFLFVAAAWFVMTSGALAETHVGSIAAVQGAVTLARAGKSYKAASGFKIYNGDTIAAPKDAFAKLLMSDDTLITVGASSSFVVERFAAGTGTRTASFRLLFGKMRAIVSKAVSASTDYRFATPTAVAGVRGTHLVLEFDQAKGATTLSVLEGNVGFKAAEGNLGEVSVSTLQQSLQKSNEAPETPTKMSSEDVKKLGTEIASQTKGADADETKQAKSDDSANEETADNADAGKSADAADAALQRADDTVKTNPTDVSGSRPTDNPAVETGVKVRW